MSDIFTWPEEFEDDVIFPIYQPELTPVSIVDVDRMPPMDMTISMSDPCPECGAFRMQVGDYVCYQSCSACFEKLIKETE